jgi:hypothetical protein
MLARVTATLAMLLLALGAFWGNALGAGHVFNPFGILFLLLGALVWFGWDTVRAGFRAARDESDLPIIRLSATAIKGLGELFRPAGRRHSPSNATDR